MKISWRELVKLLPHRNEEQVLAMLVEERAGPRRASHLERIHQRYSVLRCERERQEILREAKAL